MARLDFPGLGRLPTILSAGVLLVGALASSAPALAAGALESAKAAIRIQDYQKAAALLGPLAEQGDAEAQYQLGSLYRQGRGVAKDYARAARWMAGSTMPPR